MTAENRINRNEKFDKIPICITLPKFSAAVYWERKTVNPAKAVNDVFKGFIKYIKAKGRNILIFLEFSETQLMQIINIA